jgi:pimeloyl-ACP methyl ester carboxylesterase
MWVYVSAMLHHRVHYRGPETEWVVLVHGAGGSSSIWFRQIRAYAREFNVLLVDLRGHGASAAGASGAEPSAAEGAGGDGTRYTFEDVSRDVLEVLDHRGIESAHFVGISLGCLIIRTLAEIAPDRVRSMVLGGAIARLGLRSRLLVLVGNTFKRVIPFMWLYRLYAWILLPRAGHRESRLIFVREARKLARAEFLRWFRLTMELKPILRLFEERDVGIPTLYLMGDEDHMFLPAARNLARKHTRSALRVIERCGHVCNIQAPDRFNRFSLEFLRDPAGAVG